MTGEQISSSSKLAYIEEHFHAAFDSFHSSVGWYRRRYFFATMSAVLLSAVITLIAGWKPGGSLGVHASNVILVLGAISTVVLAWGAFFSPRESWLVYASTLNRFRALQARIDFLKREPDALTTASDSIAELFQEYQSILDAHNKAWFELRSKPNQVIHTDAPQATRR
ncbi:MAG: SLATT domain-containing protein [Candidatus Brocadiaceae bacterium]